MLSVALLACLGAACTDTATEAIPLDQSYIYCLEGDTDVSGFLSEGWLYTAEHVYNKGGLRELLTIDSVREPAKIHGEEGKVSLPHVTELPEIGDIVSLNGCDKYGEPLTGEVSLILDDGAVYGASGDTVVLVSVDEISEAPLGFSGGPALTDEGWFGITTGYSVNTDLVIVAVPPADRIR